MYIKYAIENFVTKPKPWPEKEINKYIKEMAWCRSSNIVWCYNNESLFNNKVPNNKLIDSNAIKIKYASEDFTHLPDEWDKSKIERFIKKLAQGKNFIWCYENEELFKED